MITLKEVIRPPADFGHMWAYGCPECRFGLVKPPKIHSSQPLYIQRAVQAGMGDISFCHCQAGVMYRNYLQRVWQNLQGPHFTRLQERIRSETSRPGSLR